MDPSTKVDTTLLRRGAPPVDLGDIVRKYLEIAGGFERPVHLSQLGLTKAETERILSAFDEDYQISRYMQLSRERDEVLRSFPPDARLYLINGYEVSHLSFTSGIRMWLGRQGSSSP